MTAGTAYQCLIDVGEHIQWQAAMIQELQAELMTQRNTVRLLEAKIEEMGKACEEQRS